MSELLQPIVLFALVFLGLAVRGLLEARLEQRHASVLAELGGGLVLVPPATSSIKREWAWLKFLFWEHFQVRDVLLSAISIVGAAAYLLVVLMMTGLLELS